MNKSIFFGTIILGTLLDGCGGSNPGAGTGSTPNPLAGSYNGTSTLDAGKQGTLAVTVSSTGSVSGNLTVAASRSGGRDGGFSFSLGTFSITGTVDSSGTLNATGRDPIGGSFAVTGTLSKTGSGSFSITAGGTSYNGSISLSAGGGSGSLNISNASGSNVSSTAWPATPYLLISEASGLTAVLAIPSQTDSSRSVNMMLESRATSGSDYPIDSSNLASVTIFTYTEGTGAGAKTWIANSGTFRLISKSAGRIKFQLVNAVFAPSADAGNAATGTFTLNGTLEK